MIKLIMQYYSLVSGIEPEAENFNRTLATAKYLKDNGCNNSDIFKIFKLISKQKIEGEDLPKSLWNDSLLQKGVFYYHNEFHITSKPPTWNPITFKEECEPFFIEMKIKYTMQDLIDRFYNKCKVPIGLRDNKLVEGGLKHLLWKYNNLSAPAIDYVMVMMDLADEDVDRELITNVFDIEKYSVKAFQMLEDMVQESKVTKSNEIIWRNESAM